MRPNFDVKGSKRGFELPFFEPLKLSFFLGFMFIFLVGKFVITVLQATEKTLLSAQSI